METINKINALTNLLDTLTRAGNSEAAQEVTNKLLELVKTL